jgi:hypothetical protein
MNLKNRMALIVPVLENWWNFGEQKFPCIICSCSRSDGANVPETDDLVKYWTDVDFVIDSTMTRLETTDYYGVAVPLHYVDFGSSAMACALGATVEYLNRETVWAHPHLASLNEVISVGLDENNFAYKTILAITRRSVKLSSNHHFVAPFAFGGLTDTLAGLYGTENLLMDMAINPSKVKEAMAHLLRIWLATFEKVNSIIALGGNCGGIGWAGIWAPGTTFPLQEDFSYMISPAMFREFCLPYLLEQIDAMNYPFYHLDGVGAIGHLDTLLAIPSLKAIQWQPGAGKERLDQWYELIKRIIAAKKSVQVYAQAEEVEDLIKNVGSRGLLVICENVTPQEAEQLMERYSGKE